MKTIKIKLYDFKELPEDIQEKVINNLSDINVDYDWWDFIYQDAKDIGLEISSFDIYQKEIDGELIDSIDGIIKAIMKNHGKETDTYKLAEKYQAMYEKQGQDISDDLDEEWHIDFRHDLLECYLSMLEKECEYLESREAIIETIEANEYTFEADGTMRNY